MLRERLDQRTTILTTYYSLFSLSLSLPIAVRALFEPCTFDSDRTVTLATFE